jgi:hypothetical protein
MTLRSVIDSFFASQIPTAAPSLGSIRVIRVDVVSCICAATQPRWIGHSESHSNMKQHLYLSQLGPPKTSVGFKASHAFICVTVYDFAQAGHAVGAGDLPESFDSSFSAAPLPLPPPPLPRFPSQKPWMSISEAHNPPEPNHCSTAPGLVPAAVGLPTPRHLRRNMLVCVPLIHEPTLVALKQAVTPLSPAHQRAPTGKSNAAVKPDTPRATQGNTTAPTPRRTELEPPVIPGRRQFSPASLGFIPLSDDELGNNT